MRALRARLGLDSGYLSRLLRVARGATASSTRRAERGRPAGAGSRLTAAGPRRAGASSTGAATSSPRSLLEPLTTRQRDALVDGDGGRRAAAHRRRWSRSRPADPAERRRALLPAARTSPSSTRRFDAGFDPGLSISADAARARPPAGLLLVARLRGEPVGCGALKFHGGEPAEIKRMWVARRGARPRRSAGACCASSRHARARHGAPRVRLETNRTLAEAIALYRSAGYREVAAFNDEPYAHHWFEKRLSPGTR